MRLLRELAAVLAVATAAPAQSPLTTVFAANNGGAVGGAIYFDLDVTHPAGITILQIDLNAAPASVAGTLDVYTVPGGRFGNMGNQAAWTGPGVLGSPLVTLPVDTPSPCVLTAPLHLPAGLYGVALVAGGYAHQYVGGGTINNQWPTAEVTLIAGNADNAPFSGGVFQPRTPNLRIHYANGPVGAVFATKANFGQGCVDRPDATFYEHFAPGTFDLLAPGTDSITLVHTGSGYDATGGQASYVPPSNLAFPLGLGDDDETVVGLSSPLPFGRFGATTRLWVCSNGFVSVAPGNGTGAAPSPAAMLGNPSAAWYSWHDFDPGAAGSGPVVFEERAGTAYVTWQNVHDAGHTVANTMQFQFELATGDVAIVWPAVSNLGNGHLVGFCEGGPTADPGSSDLSALLPGGIAQAAVFRVEPMRLAASARPIAGTQIDLLASGLSPGAVFGGVAFGLQAQSPPIDLGGIGMAGCFQHVTVVASVVFVPAGGAAVVPFHVPGLVGLDVFVQGFGYDPTAGLTTLGAVSSDAIHLMTGDW